MSYGCTTDVLRLLLEKILENTEILKKTSDPKEGEISFRIQQISYQIQMAPALGLGICDHFKPISNRSGADGASCH